MPNEKNIFTKRRHLGLKYNKLHWLLGKRSQLSLENTLLIYKVIFKPMWTYGVQLWGIASSSNIEILQRFQIMKLRKSADASYYINNDIIHRDLCMRTVRKEVKCASAETFKHTGNKPPR